MDYILLSGATNADLSLFVNENLKKGYRLYGSPFGSNGWCYQAMTFQKDTPND
jgi:hypothetical protein